MKLPVLHRRQTEPWYADGLSFTCTQCGNCCTGGPGYVWISDEEIRRLADYLQLTPEQVFERYCRRMGHRISLNERRNGRNYDCIFLVEQRVEITDPEHPDRRIVQTKRTCQIYPVRPLQCRTWPFWPENLTSERVWNASAKRCPGMNTGRHYSPAQLEAIRDATEWPEDGPTSDS